MSVGSFFYYIITRMELAEYLATVSGTQVSSVDIFEMSFLVGIESIFLVHSPPLAGTKDTDKNYEARLLVGRIIT